MITGRRDIQAYYADPRQADAYIARRFHHALGRLLHDAQLGFLKALLHQVAVRRVLELAPGPARLTADLDPPAVAVALDVNASMLRQAAVRLRACGRPWHLCQGDAFRLPFGRAFDLVYTFRLLRHFDREDRRRLYDEIGRVLHPGGLLVFDAVNAPVSRRVRHRLGTGQQGVHDALLTRPQLAAELAQAGFQLLRLQGVYSHYLLQYWAQVYLGPRSPRLAEAAIRWLEHAGSPRPLEWIVLCRRR